MSNFVFRLAFVAIAFLVTLITSTNQLLLDEDGKFDVTWTLNGDKSIVTFTVNLESSPEGFIALGVSQGMMINSDVAVYEILGGKKKIQDYYVKENREKPILDKQQDITVIKMERNGNTTQIIFSRKLVTGDPNKGQDMDIKEGDTFLIWAYGATPELDYHHSTRGSKTVDIFVPPTTTTATDAPTKIDLDINQEIRRDIEPASEATTPVEATILKPSIPPPKASGCESLGKTRFSDIFGISTVLTNLVVLFLF